MPTQVFSLELSAEQEALVDVVDGLAKDVVAPAARCAQDHCLVPPDVSATLHGTGLFAPVEQAYGGGGVPDALTQALAIEGLARGDGAITAAVVSSGNAALVIGVCGTSAQRTELLPRFARDPQLRGSVATYEGFGRPRPESTTAIGRDGGGWRVTGCKVAVAFGAEADPLVVVGTDAADGRLRAVLVRGSDPGVASSSSTLGLEAARMAVLELECAVDEGSVLGGADADPDGLARVISRVRLSLGAIALERHSGPGSTPPSTRRIVSPSANRS